MKRMMTKKKGIADHEAEAKALELKDQDIYVPEIKQKQEAAKTTEQKAESKMKRQETLKKNNKVVITSTQAGIDKNAMKNAANDVANKVNKAVVVGKQESGCCTIF